MSTPLQLIALAGINQNTAINVSSALTNALSSWNSQTWVSQLKTAIINGNAVLSNTAKISMTTIGNTTCPALGDTVPANITGITLSYTTPGETGQIALQAAFVINQSDLSKFCQAFSSATGYVATVNQVISTNTNSATFLGPTFAGMDSLTTGDVSKMNAALPEFGQDLRQLGNLINLQRLGDLGTPALLLYQVFSRGVLPSVNNAMLTAGIPADALNNITQDGYVMPDGLQKLAYQAMTQIIGDDLSQVLAVLGVTTPNIMTMADLLNPVKIFPRSFRTMTTATTVGTRGIYLDNQGTVNTNLIQQLPAYYIREVVA